MLRLGMSYGAAYQNSSWYFEDNDLGHCSLDSSNRMRA